MGVPNKNDRLFLYILLNCSIYCDMLKKIKDMSTRASSQDCEENVTFYMDVYWETSLCK